MYALYKLISTPCEARGGVAQSEFLAHQAVLFRPDWARQVNATGEEALLGPTAISLVSLVLGFISFRRAAHWVRNSSRKRHTTKLGAPIVTFHSVKSQIGSLRFLSSPHLPLEGPNLHVEAAGPVMGCDGEHRKPPARPPR